ncbi:hypothetical protein EPYR_03845 [Erwinia pyrifoliae DSM 12163]|nr:hypothetical protein CPI84_00480 [Erwinia pyrifoliae]MCA8875151.1 hypothetical protein [Erwinia pyrifoliae]CAX57354.1 conserved uncharacterized protein [Erwinia pyrifoliae Ep1/96]CAY76225.1 hypothetical protein EPYR_03845 [Erwinia pyrifoliae DSM 12163]
MKKIFKIILFFVLLIAVSVLTFEIAFRFGDADAFISLLGCLSFLGFKESFDSLFIFLLILSFLIAVLIYCCTIKFIKKKNFK